MTIAKISATQKSVSGFWAFSGLALYGFPVYPQKI